MFIVESPFQLISAIEANIFFGGKNLFIVKYNCEEKNDQQLKKIIQFFHLDNIIEINPIFNNFDANIQLLYILKKLKKTGQRFERIFIGEYRSFHMRKFFDYYADSKSYCLDDGNVVYETSKFILEKKDQYYNETIKGKIKKYIYEIEAIIFQLNSLPIKRDIRLFTCFDIVLKKNYIKHNFDGIKSRFTFHKKQIVYFYGTNLETLGIDLEEEMRYFRNIMHYYQKKQLSIIYFAHRKESKFKLDKLQKQFNIDVVYNEYPAEIQIMVDKNVPTHIASYGSTVLITLPKIYHIENVVSFFPNFASIKEEYRNEWSVMQSKYKKQMECINLI